MIFILPFSIKEEKSLTCHDFQIMDTGWFKKGNYREKIMMHALITDAEGKPFAVEQNVLEKDRY